MQSSSHSVTAEGVPPTFSVIILSYNSSRFIEQCLTSVFETDHPSFEVIFVDNHSTDDSVRLASRAGSSRKNFRLINSDKNLGFAGGNNLGARAARGKFLVFLNVDTEVTRQWLRGIEAGFSRAPNIGVIQAKLLLLGDRRTFDSAGDAVDYFGYGMSLAGDWREDDRGQYDFPYETFSARGAALAMRSDLFRRLGGFDESFFLDYEDIDLSWRTRLAGYKVMFEPASTVYHAASSRDFAERSATRSHHSIKNRITMVTKNYELSNFLKYALPSIMLFLVLYTVGSIYRRSPRILLLILKGNLWVLLNFQTIIKSRRVVQGKIRAVPDSEIRPYMIQTSLTKRMRFYHLLWRIGIERASRWYAEPNLKNLRKNRINRLPSTSAQS